MTPTDLDAYFEQFRGDTELPTHEDYIAVCRAKGHHEWYKLYGGFQCRQCGIQIPVHEPFNQATMVLVIARQAELDAELRKT